MRDATLFGFGAVAGLLVYLSTRPPAPRLRAQDELGRDPRHTADFDLVHTARLFEGR